MKTLPPDAVAYKQTRLFTEADVPRAITTAHTTRAGVWGRLEVLSGTVRYCILEGDAAGTYALSPERPGVIEPTVLHRVELSGPATFQVVFLRVGAP